MPARRSATPLTSPFARPAPRPAASSPPPAPGRPAVREAGWGLPLARVLLLLLVATLVLINVIGYPYYSLSTAERVRHPWHPWLKPAGIVGQSTGIVALLLFLSLWLYPLRKKFRWLSFTGTVGRWLDVHVLIGLCIPLTAAVHAAWHFTGLIGLGYGAMLVAWLSGILGRYIYSRIPRSRNGLELSREEVNAQRESHLARIAAATGLDQEMVEHLLSTGPVPSGMGPIPAFFRMIADDVRRWRAARIFRARWKRAAGGRDPVDPAVFTEILRLARREMALDQQIRMLEASRRVFQYWHVAHRPMAISALVAVLLHVVTAIVLGVTWFR